MIQSLLSFAQCSFPPLDPLRFLPPPVRQPPLEPLETNPRAPEYPFAVGTPAALALDQSFRHSGWATARWATDESLRRVSPSFERILQFEGCGEHAWVERSDDSPTTYRVRCNRCHDRWCLPCGQERSRVIAHNVRAHLDARRARFITLTLRSDREPLQYLLDHLYASFTRLRRTKLWRNTQTGGVAFCEVKWSPRTERWHPHLHILTEGKYIAKEALSKAWHKATGDSFIIDVRKVSSADRAIAYVTKYASKPHDASIWREPRRLDEAILAMRGRRLCLTYGTWRGVKLTEVPESGEWTPIAPLATLIGQARSGDTSATQILSRLPGTVLPTESRAPPDEKDANAEDDRDAVAENRRDGQMP